MKKNAFTLVELIISLTLIGVLAGSAVAIINPVEMMRRATDAKRKADVEKIKTAFESYYGDRKAYPASGNNGQYGSTMIQIMNDKINCGKKFFAPYLTVWPCNEKGVPYIITIDQTNTMFPQSFIAYPSGT